MTLVWEIKFLNQLTGSRLIANSQACIQGSLVQGQNLFFTLFGSGALFWAVLINLRITCSFAPKLKSIKIDFYLKYKILYLTIIFIFCQLCVVNAFESSSADYFDSACVTVAS